MAQTLKMIFTQQVKPLELMIVSGRNAGNRVLNSAKCAKQSLSGTASSLIFLTLQRRHYHLYRALIRTEETC